MNYQFGLLSTICALVIISQVDSQSSDVTFTGSGDSMVTTCTPGASISWSNTSYTGGGPRSYYVNKGVKNSLDACVQECVTMPECYFATMTGSKTCYLLTTTPNVQTVVCKYYNTGHYGTVIEYCSIFQPCPSAFKMCGACSLSNSLAAYCKNYDMTEAEAACPAPTTTSTTTTTTTPTTTPTTTTTTVPTTTAKQADIVFVGSGDSMVATCSATASLSWFNKTWTSGGPRSYYVNRGVKNSLDECVQACAAMPTCYFATFTFSKTCYFLTTSPNIQTVHCPYLKADQHYGTMLEICSIVTPCPSAYKICGSCSLVAALKAYCADGSERGNC